MKIKYYVRYIIAFFALLAAFSIALCCLPEPLNREVHFALFVFLIIFLLMKRVREIGY